MRQGLEALFIAMSVKAQFRFQRQIFFYPNHPSVVVQHY